MRVTSIDHVVLVARDVEATLAWYERVLGAEIRDLEAWRQQRADYPVVHFGRHKLNVHPAGATLTPRATTPTPGSLDLCFGWSGDVDSAHRHLVAHGLDVEVGPVPQVGALGAGQSVYVRDPDGNLVELICYPPEVQDAASR